MVILKEEAKSVYFSSHLLLMHRFCEDSANGSLESLHISYSSSKFASLVCCSSPLQGIYRYSVAHRVTSSVAVALVIRAPSP